MEILNWIGNHPVLSVLFLAIFCSTVETVTYNLRKR